MMKFLVAAAVFSLAAHTALGGEVRERIPLVFPSGKTGFATLVKFHSEGQKKLPVLMVFGGFESADQVLGLLNPTQPVILASFDYPFSGTRQFQFPLTLLQAPELKATVSDTVGGIQVLTEALKKRSDVDASKVGIIGASLGSPFASAAAARDPQLSPLILVHGFADIQGTIENRLRQVWENRLGVFRTPLAWLSSQIVSSYLELPNPEADLAALGSSQKVLVIEATEDHFIPKSSRELLWSSLQKSQASSKLIRMPGDHLQPGSWQLIAELMRIIENWVSKLS